MFSYVFPLRALVDCLSQAGVLFYKSWYLVQENNKSDTLHEAVVTWKRVSESAPCCLFLHVSFQYCK